MKHRKNGFRVGDDIRQFKRNEEIKIGTVVQGPIRVDGVDHYHVKWTWTDPLHFNNNVRWLTPDTEIICDMVSTKYHYN